MKKGQKRILALIGVLIALIFGYFLANEMNYQVSLPEHIHVIELDESKAFLLQAERGYLLFDTGYPWDFKTFTSYLEDHHIDPSSINYVLLSHAHDDHVGFINDLVSLNPSSKVILHEKSIPLLANGANNKDNGGGLFNRIALLAFKTKQLFKSEWDLTFPPYEVRDTDIIVRGEAFDLPDEIGIKGKILFTPGHTSDSISLLYNEEYLICGDLTSTTYNLIGGKQLTVFNENIDDVYSSWRMILEMEIPYIVPSHGTPFRTEKLEKYIGKIDQDDLVTFF